MWFDHGRVTFLTKKNSGKAKSPKICISFGGSMPIAQIKSGNLTPSPRLGEISLWSGPALADQSSTGTYEPGLRFIQDWASCYRERSTLKVTFSQTSQTYWPTDAQPTTRLLELLRAAKTLWNHTSILHTTWGCVSLNNTNCTIYNTGWSFQVECCCV